jgi:Fe-S-cluster-containing dehydrogenase component
MSGYYIEQDQKRCIGCHACEVHCKTAHDVPVGPRRCRIVPVGPKQVRGVPRMSFVFMPCFHCEKPWCVAACPTGAMQKRARDGIVFVEPSRCVGCKSCITACPWGSPQWDAGAGTVTKCDYCMGRIDRGLEPACVTKCTARALRWTTPGEASLHKRERRARELGDLR